MELTCSRCHQTIESGYCYCPACGLPQFVYSAEDSAGAAQSEGGRETVHNAGSVDWRAALRSTLPVAIPAGVLCSLLSPVGIFGLLLMAGTAAWAVTLYTRRQRPSWITVAAGARIGLVTGVVGSWTAAAATGLSLFAMRFWLHKGSTFDDFWQGVVNQQLAQGSSVGADAQTLAQIKALMISPEGRAGMVLFAVAFLIATLLLFSVAGGALGARLLARSRQTGN